MNFSHLIKNTPGVPILLQISNIMNKIFILETLLYQEWDNFYNKKTQLLRDLTLIAEGMALQVKKDNSSQTNLPLDVNSQVVVIWVNFSHPTFNQRRVPLNCKDRIAAIKTF
jgi:hypothetical protein